MKDLYDLLVINKVSPNGLFVLHCTHNLYMYPNYVNFNHEQYRLEITGHLRKENATVGTVYKITEKGLHLLREAEHILTKMKRAKKSVNIENWEEHVAKYNEMFPKGKKEGSSVSFRTNPRELMDRFMWFFKEYPEYTWDHVFKATEKYLNTFDESTGFTYMQTSKYFIKKDDKSKTTTSTLATMCYNIVEGNDTEVPSGYHYFGP
jgi:predicted transcriptional regulator